MTKTTKHLEMRNTVFGDVLAEQLEKRGLEVTPFKVGKLAENGQRPQRGHWSPHRTGRGRLTGLAEKLDLSEPEKMELAVANIFEERRLS